MTPVLVAAPAPAWASTPPLPHMALGTMVQVTRQSAADPLTAAAPSTMAWKGKVQRTAARDANDHRRRQLAVVVLCIHRLRARAKARASQRSRRQQSDLVLMQRCANARTQNLRLRKGSADEDLLLILYRATSPKRS